MKKTDKPKMLPSVTIMAKRMAKPEMVRLYPKGTAMKTQIDSLKKLQGGAKAVGSPMKGTNQYGAQQSANIKMMLKKKK